MQTDSESIQEHQATVTRSNGMDRIHDASPSKLRLFYHRLRSVLGLRSNSLKQSLEEVIEEHDAVGESIDPEEKIMLHNVLTFSELDVEDVMVPRADVVWVDHEISLDELKKVIAEKAHTRIPVCRQSLDDVLGFLHTKDLVAVLCNGEAFDADTVMRQALFVPPSMKVNTLLLKMQLSHVHIALVVDEYGGTAGLVTMEDLMEEIVGEIEDEHDVSEDNAFYERGDNVFEASGRMPIRELEDKLTLKLSQNEEDEDYDTLGGLIFTLLGRVPATGEVALYQLEGQPELEFEVTEADPRKIKRVLIRKKAA